MAQLWSAFIPQTAPSEVWVRLPVEEQTRVVRLLAHLAYHVVTTDSQLPSRREARDAATDPYQTPA